MASGNLREILVVETLRLNSNRRGSGRPSVLAVTESERRRRAAMAGAWRHLRLALHRSSFPTFPRPSHLQPQQLSPFPLPPAETLPNPPPAQMIASSTGHSRLYHDGRPRGPLWRGKKMIGKEALHAIQGLKRFRDDEEKLGKFVSSHVSRLLKMDMIAVLCELERQMEVALAVKIFGIIRREIWYKPDVYLYKDLIVALAKGKKMEEAMQIWDSMKKDELFPDSQTYAEVIRGFLKYGSPTDAMNIYEDMKKSPDPPEELPFRVLLRGLIPHPLLRNKVKKDFEELFPDRHIYDPPEEIFGMR